MVSRAHARNEPTSHFDTPQQSCFRKALQNTWSLGAASSEYHSKGIAISKMYSRSNSWYDVYYVARTVKRTKTSHLINHGRHISAQPASRAISTTKDLLFPYSL